MFPAGAAGIALLILRFAVAGMMVESSIINAEPAILSLKSLLTIAAVCLLCIGLFTPATCVLPIVLEAASVPQLSGVAVANTALSVAVTTSLLLLGPGAYSVDSRLFGRRLLTSSSE
jgi:hypothetical protein